MEWRSHSTDAKISVALWYVPAAPSVPARSIKFRVASLKSACSNFSWALKVHQGCLDVRHTRLQVVACCAANVNWNMHRAVQMHGAHFSIARNGSMALLNPNDNRNDISTWLYSRRSRREKAQCALLELNELHTTCSTSSKELQRTIGTPTFVLFGGALSVLNFDSCEPRMLWDISVQLLAPTSPPEPGAAVASPA